MYDHHNSLCPCCGVGRFISLTAILQRSTILFLQAKSCLKVYDIGVLESALSIKPKTTCSQNLQISFKYTSHHKLKSSKNDRILKSSMFLFSFKCFS